MWQTFFIFIFMCLNLLGLRAEESQAARPSLVLLEDADPKIPPPQTSVYHATFIADASLNVVCSQESRAEIWKLGSFSELSSLPATLIGISEAQVLDDEDSVVVSCPLRVSYANLKRGTKNEFETKDVIGWPFCANPSGLCIWSEPDGNDVRAILMDVRSPFRRTVPLRPGQAVMNFDLSPDAKRVAIALNTNQLQVEDVDGKGKAFFLPLALPDPLPDFPNSMVELNKLHPRFTFESYGAPNIVKFNPRCDHIYGRT